MIFQSQCSELFKHVSLSFLFVTMMIYILPVIYHYNSPYITIYHYNYPYITIYHHNCPYITIYHYNYPYITIYHYNYLNYLYILLFHHLISNASKDLLAIVGVIWWLSHHRQLHLNSEGGGELCRQSAGCRYHCIHGMCVEHT